jgi:uncharacterized delta-60 repeat protein
MIASRKALIVVAAFVLMAVGLPWGGNVPAAFAQISVTAADPPSGDQGTVGLLVTIKGNGFKKGAKTAFLRHDNGQSGGISVRSTQYVSSTQLVATVDIAADATTDVKFDIQVTNADGRTGKGTELFKVTVKIDPCTLSNPGPTLSPYTSAPPGRPGYFDSTFGNGTGKVIGPRYMNVRAVRVQNIQGEPRVLAVGSRQDQCQRGALGTWALVRYHSDGTPDESFGVGGFVIQAFAKTEILYSLAIDGSNRILVTGGVPITKQNSTGVVARYTMNGTLDTQFGGTGIVFMPPSLPPYQKYSGSASAVAVQPDGKIVVAGYLPVYVYPSGYVLQVVRLNSDGTLDTSFNGTGQVLFTPTQSGIKDIAFQRVNAKDSIVLAGWHYDPATGVRSGALWRITDTGVFDTSFGGSGLVLTTFDGAATDFDGVTVDGSSRLVAVGYKSVYPQYPSDQLGVARFDLAGNLDTTFGNGGTVVVQSPLTQYGGSVAVQPEDGSILVGGESTNADGSIGTATVWRFFPGGVPDLAFGVDGMIQDSIIEGERASAWNGGFLVLQADGKVVWAGNVTTTVGTCVALARFWR